MNDVIDVVGLLLPPDAAPRDRIERRCGSYGPAAAGAYDLTNSGESFREDARFRVLRLLEDTPELTQREIADALGISLGAVNFCLRGLVEKGAVKVENFRTSRNKLAYGYLLTPRGVREKARLTRGFLERRLAEYAALRAEIEDLSSELASGTEAGR